MSTGLVTLHQCLCAHTQATDPRTQSEHHRSGTFREGEILRCPRIDSVSDTTERPLRRQHFVCRAVDPGRGTHLVRSRYRIAGVGSHPASRRHVCSYRVGHALPLRSRPGSALSRRRRPAGFAVRHLRAGRDRHDDGRSVHGVRPSAVLPGCDRTTAGIVRSPRCAERGLHGRHREDHGPPRTPTSASRSATASSTTGIR